MLRILCQMQQRPPRHASVLVACIRLDRTGRRGSRFGARAFDFARTDRTPEVVVSIRHTAPDGTTHQARSPQPTTQPGMMLD